MRQLLSSHFTSSVVRSNCGCGHTLHIGHVHTHSGIGGHGMVVVVVVVGVVFLINAILTSISCMVMGSPYLMCPASIHCRWLNPVISRMSLQLPYSVLFVMGSV